MWGLQGLTGKALISAVAAAEKLQADRASTQETVLAQEVEGAPAVELISGDGDVSTTGAGTMAIASLDSPARGILLTWGVLGSGCPVSCGTCRAGHVPPHRDVSTQQAAPDGEFS